MTDPTAVPPARDAGRDLSPSSVELEDFFKNGSIALHIIGADGRIVRANQAELDLLGYREHEYLGRYIREFHVDRATIDEILVNLAEGKRVNGRYARLRSRSGAIKHVLITSSANMNGGQFQHSRCFTVDITERFTAEQAREQAATLGPTPAHVLDLLPVPVYATDAEGHVTYFNEAAAEFAGRRPILGMDRWCVTWRLRHLDGRTLPHDECPMAVALKENRAVRGALAIAERPDGTLVPFQPFPTPLYDAQGVLIGAVNMLVRTPPAANDAITQRSVAGD